MLKIRENTESFLFPSPGPQIVKPQNVTVKGVYLTYNQSPSAKLLDFEMFTSCHFFYVAVSCNV